MWPCAMMNGLDRLATDSSEPPRYAREMPNCSSSPIALLLLPTLAGSLLCTALMAGVAHSVLRIFLEARGVSPWRVRDSLGSMPLVLLGAGMVGAAITLASASTVASCPMSNRAWVPGVLSAALALVGLALLRLGLLALRKLV